MAHSAREDAYVQEAGCLTLGTQHLAGNESNVLAKREAACAVAYNLLMSLCTRYHNHSIKRLLDISFISTKSISVSVPRSFLCAL